MTDWRGQDAPIEALLSALATERLHQAWLFGGPEGIGKCGIALAFAKRLLGARPLADPDRPLASQPGDHAAHLVDIGAHPDLIQVRRLVREGRKAEEASPSLARNISVDQIRSLSRFLHLAPSMASRRVVLIDAADDLERGAANALLKNLEEPPRETIFLLVSHAPGRLLPTIRSRCRFLTFNALGQADMRAVLSAEAPDLPQAERDRLIDAAEGSPGRALAMRDLDMGALEQRLEAIARHDVSANAHAVALARALSGKAAQARYEAFLELVPHMLARKARKLSRPDRHIADAWSEAADLARSAVPLSLDPGATVFALCGIVARATAKP